MEIAPPFLTPLVIGFNILLISSLMTMVYLSGNSRFQVFIAGLTLTLWLLLFALLAMTGIFEAKKEQFPPLIGPGIIVPTILGAIFIIKHGAFQKIIDSIPLHWLIRFQFYRIVGLLFLILYWQGLLPGEFAITAGLGDIAIGLTALLVAWMLEQKKPYGNRVALAWGYFGVADLVWAVSLGFRSSPGPLQSLALETPNYMISAYPLVLIPTFAVPIFLLAHLVTLIRLMRTEDKV